MKAKTPTLSTDQTKSLHYAQRMLELNKWSFARYSQYLSLYVYNIN